MKNFEVLSESLTGKNKTFKKGDVVNESNLSCKADLLVSRGLIKEKTVSEKSGKPDSTSNKKPSGGKSSGN